MLTSAARAHQAGAKCKQWFEAGKEEFVVTVIEAIREMVSVGRRAVVCCAGPVRTSDEVPGLRDSRSHRQRARQQGGGDSVTRARRMVRVFV